MWRVVFLITAFLYTNFLDLKKLGRKKSKK